MTKEIRRKLTKADLDALIEWGLIHRSSGREVTIEDIAERLQGRGISKDKRTLFRYKEKIDFKFEELLKEKGYSLDGFLDWEQKNFFDEFIDPAHIWFLRSACFWYERTVSSYTKHQFPTTVTYRWCVWASYFLSSVRNPLDYVHDNYLWAVGQTFASRDLMRSVGEDTEFADLQGWLMARPWERGENEKVYNEMISTGRYMPLKRIQRAVHPEKTTIERIGVPFLANAVMTILSAPQLKDKEGFDDYDKCYLLPSQQIALIKEAYNGSPPAVEVHIPDFETLHVRI